MDNSDIDQCEDSSLIPGYKDPNAYSQDALRSILAATKASNDLPSAGDDFDYYSTFHGFRAVLLRKGQSILSLMTSLIQNQGSREKFQGRELEEKFDLLVDVNDLILENVSNSLDEVSGLKKSESELVLAVKPFSAINTSWNKKQFNSSPAQNCKLLSAKNISRPQLSFKDKIDNSNAVFIPIIKEKPNSIKPLAVILERDGETEEFCHPYEWEIERFTPKEEHLQTVELVLPKPLEETPLMLVSTEEQLKHLCRELKQQDEFAVDLEHHSYRSFQGFTCLMQISTREKDYIVDVLQLRSELHILNEVFTDPKIVKVFHGADMDILWLQRDFGIYVVNLFDTGQAARVLHFAHLSLQYLLKHYCKLDLDKKFQLADWRIRPLPAEMIKYAREDTHYLLYVYDCLKNDLIQNGNEMKNLLHSTFERSKMICSKKYQKPVFTEEKYIELYKKSKKTLNAKQLYCLKELVSWRNKIARETDESLAYVLPNHMLLQIAEALPREQQGILACCNPIPPMVKQQLNELHSLVLKASESSLKQLESLELQQKAQTHKVNNHIDLANFVHCPHDVHHLHDRKVQLSNQSSENSLPIISKSPSSSAISKKRPALTALFERNPKKIKFSDNPESSPLQKVAEIVKKLVSPYERYKMTQQLKSNEESKNSERPATTELSNEEKNGSEKSSVAESSTTHKESEEVIDTQNRTIVLDTSCEIVESTSMRKKNKKKKRQRPEPDISLITPEPETSHASKKSRTPEVVILEDDSFTPYDYSQTDYSVFAGKRKQEQKRGKHSQSNFQGPGRHFGRNRKQAKQATFSRDTKNDTNSKWPQNK